MPHKKNPDVFELIRAKSNQIKTLPAQIQAVISNLPSGYHRDFQVLKEILFPGIVMLKDVLSMLLYAIPDRFKERVIDDPIYKYLDSVNQIQQLVAQGASFRTAYGRSVKKYKTELTFLDQRTECIPIKEV